MARQKKPDRFVCIEDRGSGELRYRVHAVRDGLRAVEGFRTLEEAQAKRDWIVKVTAHLHTASVAVALEQHFEDMVRLGKWRADATVFPNRKRLVRKFLSPILDVSVGSVTPAHVDRCCKAWDTPSRPSPWTRRLGRTHARTFFSWAVKQRLIRTSPINETHASPSPRLQLGRLRLDDARRLRAVVDPAAAAGDASATFVLVALLLGARTSEITGLTTRSFDDGGRMLIYPDAKSPTIVYRVRLPVVLQAALKTLAEASTNGFLFPPRGRSTGEIGTWGASAVRRWAREAELEMAEEMDARWMRRTKDSLAVEAGVSSEVVARETGHTLHVARRHYIQHGAETAGRAAVMDEATLVPIGDRISTGSRKMAK